MSKITFIVCAHDEPDTLTCCLYSLKCQSFKDFDVIVTDRMSTPNNAAHQKRIVERMQDKRFTYMFTEAPDIYTAAEEAAKHAKGEYLCFPSADSYYVPLFAETVLKVAEQTNADMVYCDMLYDPRYNRFCYDVMTTAPALYFIDKTGFIVKKEWLEKVPFPGKAPVPSRTPSDGLFIDEIVRQGAKCEKAPGVMIVHN